MGREEHLVTQFFHLAAVDLLLASGGWPAGTVRRDRSWLSRTSPHSWSAITSRANTRSSSPEASWTAPKGTGADTTVRGHRSTFTTVLSCDAHAKGLGASTQGAAPAGSTHGWQDGDQECQLNSRSGPASADPDIFIFK